MDSVSWGVWGLIVTRAVADKAAAHLWHIEAFVCAPTVPHCFSTPLNAVRLFGVPRAPLFFLP
jgi:hypothetical protein